MEKKEWNQLWRIPLAVSAIIGIVYLIIYLFTGSIPVVDKLTLFKDPMWGLPPEYELPFPMSRAWDVAFAFIFGVLMVRAIQCTEKYDENLPIGLGFRFASGLIFGSASGLIFVSGFGFVSGLVGFGFGFVSGLKFGLKLGIGFGIGFGLGFGFVSSLVVGFGFGLALILVVGLMFCLGVSLGFGLKCLFSKSFWKKIITWLAGE